MLKHLEDAIAEYTALYRAPALEAIKLSGLYALHPEDGNLAECSSLWPEKYPNADESGIYAFFGKSMELLYVGSAANLNSRVGSYFRYDLEGTRKCVARHQWRVEPWYLATAPVPEQTKYEALSLEAFLISKLSPLLNSAQYLWR